MKSVLLFGLGRFGRYMALRLQEVGNDVMGIDHDEQKVNAALAYVTEAKIGDSTDENFIKTLGVRNFDLCVVAIGDDFESSLETTALLKDCGATRILARAATDIHEKLLLRNGADYVIYPVKLAANYAATRYTTDNVLDYLALTEDYSICEMTVPGSWSGQTLAALEVRKRYNVNIIAIKEGHKMKSMPGADYTFSGGETLMVMGHNTDLRKFLK